MHHSPPLPRTFHDGHEPDRLRALSGERSEPKMDTLGIEPCPLSPPSLSLSLSLFLSPLSLALALPKAPKIPSSAIPIARQCLNVPPGALIRQSVGDPPTSKTHGVRERPK